MEFMNIRKRGLTIKSALCIRVIWGVYLGIMGFHQRKLTLQAHAKINFGLYVTGKRPDGFHNIETVFHRVAVADTIELSPSREIIVESTDPGAPSGETNICHRAARLLHDILQPDDGVHCVITKRIPIGAGLGGGSADAAAVLRALPSFWKRKADSGTVGQLALELGSDVPFFLGAGSALAHGRGETLELLPLDVPYAILLCHPNIHVATAWAYAQIRPRANPHPDLRSMVLQGMKDPRILREGLINEFENPVFNAFPEIRRVKETLLREGAVFASMSGSGSTVYGLFPDLAGAESAKGAFAGTGYRTFLTPPHFTP
jgi:4-diphosphocytidyl-2-C-methyl-D-erythritol kinase